MLNIALFGTSADPPTAGHQAIIRWLSQHYDWVAVWASNNPFKSHQTPLEHRVAMLRLLIEDLEPYQNPIGLYPELSSSRTLETVEKARSRWPEAKLTLVIGSDLVTQLPRWYRVEDLLQQVQLLVIPRPGCPVDEAGVETLREMGGEVAISYLEPPAVSSTAYREKGDTKVLPPPIEDYIHREQLYAWQKR
jgi:nicotinate-nucleotide adenylyltransferase